MFLEIIWIENKYSQKDLGKFLGTQAHNIEEYSNSCSSLGVHISTGVKIVIADDKHYKGNETDS